MNSLEEEINSLVELCKQEFDDALRHYLNNPVMGRVVDDQAIPQTLRRINQMIIQFPEHSEGINNWLNTLAPFRRNEILENHSACMKAIESLTQIIS